MLLKFVNATELRSGSYIITDDNAPCVVKSIDISKTGKHGASKARIEAIGVIDGKKRILLKPGSDRFAVPMIEKRRGQVLSVNGGANIMDTETFETIVIPIPDELRQEIKEGSQVEYWDIEGQKIVKRII